MTGDDAVSSTFEVRIVRVDAEATYALRQRVLRPHQRLDGVGFAGDLVAGASHFAAVGETGEIVGVVTVHPEPAPFNDESGWRLRGMATAPEVRGTGVGRGLLRAVIDEVTDHGGGLLWCSARRGAVGFYENAGMRTVGEEWEEPDIGPHVTMCLSVPGDRTRHLGTVSNGVVSNGVVSNGVVSNGVVSNGDAANGMEPPTRPRAR